MRSKYLLLLCTGLLVIAVGCGTAQHDAEPLAQKTHSASEAPAKQARNERHAAFRDSGKDSAPAARPPSASESAPEPHAKKRFAKPQPQPAPVAIKQPQHQSGTLTAGSLDDHAGYADFRNFFSSVLQQSGNRNLPKLNIGRRIEIAVRDKNGKPVGNARLVIRRAEEGANAPVAEFPTGTDGKGVFLPGVDGNNNGAAFRVTATSHDGKQSATEVFEFGQGNWNLTLAGADTKLPTRLDLALVVDTTGSMEDELDYLKAEIDGIARAVHERYPNVDQRFALILYRDQGDEYVTRTFDFTGSIDEFRKSLSGQSANGGGDMPEAVHAALEQSLKLGWRGGNTARVMFLIGDAPPHQRDEQQSLDYVGQLRKRGVTIFPVAASGAQKRAEFLFRIAAFLTRGQYLFLTDHSGVGNPHAKPHASKYSVERLDQLMIRMIASQLAGKKLLPRDVIANERTKPGSKQDPVRAQRPRQQTRTSTPPMLPPTPTVNHVDNSQHSIGIEASSFRWVLGVIAICGIVFLERLRR